MMKRLPRGHFLGALSAGLPVSAFPVSRALAAEAYTMRLNVPTGPTSVLAVVGTRFAAAVNRRSHGLLTIEVYPNGQLAREQASIESLTTGVLDLTIQGTSFLQPLFPRYQIFDLPFLFRNLAAGYRVLDGSIGREFFAELETRGIVGLAWGAGGGFKELSTTSKAIVAPEDLKGLRIRIMTGAVYLATYQALGAIPVTIDFAEAYTALEQHTVDGMDLGLNAVADGKFYTVIKHVAMSNHILSLGPLIGSKSKVEALPSALQEVLKTEAKAIVPFWRSLVARQLADSADVLKRNGVAFTETDYSAFRKAVDPVYSLVQAKFGSDLIARITRAANAG